MYVNKKQFEASLDLIEQARTLLDIAWEKMDLMEDMNARQEFEKKMEDDND